jgi:hypothetical protein
MPAEYLSRLPPTNDKVADITECFHLFQPGLKECQKADIQLQHMNFFQTKGT